MRNVNNEVIHSNIKIILGAGEGCVISYTGDTWFSVAPVALTIKRDHHVRQV